ncbi:hypothetical protein EDEG_01643 [Edhazardia aedis USNM 41457]|uniref:Uncharacterized protein n=1 Tax=Edhazardia aedis (strain USNM 41457) TaxID=1003232 RepID=J9DS01_EDHAE|nr:hypothetical protein EDEG_01643 [Edhazardia aedis USNM 41457]|eukprot:EJW04067.1 hypothetical protein EDEG_01643 [Edhazardia aedis USNM 41457]
MVDKFFALYNGNSNMSYNLSYINDPNFQKNMRYKSDLNDGNCFSHKEKSYFISQDRYEFLDNFMILNLPLNNFNCGSQFYCNRKKCQILIKENDLRNSLHYFKCSCRYSKELCKKKFESENIKKYNLVCASVFGYQIEEQKNNKNYIFIDFFDQIDCKKNLPKEYINDAIVGKIKNNPLLVHSLENNHEKIVKRELWFEKINTFEPSKNNCIVRTEQMLSKYKADIDLNYSVDNVILLSDKNISEILNYLKSNFISKEVNNKALYHDVLYILKRICIKAAKKILNPIGENYHPKDDIPVNNSDRIFVNLSLDLLINTLRKKIIQASLFASVFTDSDISYLIEQLQTEDLQESTKIVRFIQLVILLDDNFLPIIKKKDSNEIILFCEGIRHHRGVLELVNIIYFLQLKNKYVDEKEAMKHFQICLLPLLDKKVFEIFTEESIQKIFGQFFIANKIFALKTVEYVSRIFSKCGTKSQSIMFTLIKNLLTDKQNDFYLKDFSVHICSILNYILKSQNHILVDLLVAFMLDKNISKQIGLDIKFYCESLFSNLYYICKNYWSVRDRGKTLLVLSMLFRKDPIIFDKCLQNHNKAVTKNNLLNKINDSLTLEMLGEIDDIEIVYNENSTNLILEKNTLDHVSLYGSKI